MSKQNAMVNVVSKGRQRALFTTDDLSTRWNCSSRHVSRLADDGQIPPPVKLGNLVRWQRSKIEAWEAEGCPMLRNNQGERTHV